VLACVSRYRQMAATRRIIRSREQPLTVGTVSVSDGRADDSARRTRNKIKLATRRGEPAFRHVRFDTRLAFKKQRTPSTGVVPKKSHGTTGPLVPTSVKNRRFPRPRRLSWGNPRRGLVSPIRGPKERGLTSNSRNQPFRQPRSPTARISSAVFQACTVTPRKRAIERNGSNNTYRSIPPLAVMGSFG